jgi:hypothetical protein
MVKNQWAQLAAQQRDHGTCDYRAKLHAIRHRFVLTQSNAAPYNPVSLFFWPGVLAQIITLPARMITRLHGQAQSEV